MPYFELRPFDLAEAETVAHWVLTSEEYWKLTGAQGFPLTADQVAAWIYETNFAFTLRRDGDIVAYGDIIEDEVEGDVEIQHLIVAPDVRRDGVGSVMMNKLCAFLVEYHKYPEVWTRVGRDNEAAIQCALGSGFLPDQKLSGERYLWMKKILYAE
ncbi:MAG: GNAT family N-acetyltransferase [Capsulimonas sp.]|uniref:GNAT family N-acetyltransferase n=1 Tax=Capsulimonas sp. TaxID=2494211 RepID=UPI00326752A9